MNLKNIFKIVQKFMNPRVAEEEENLELERQRNRAENNREKTKASTDVIGKECIIEGKAFKVAEHIKAPENGNCGFSSIYGVTQLKGSMNRGDIVRQIKHNMGDESVQKLINNDIKALYQEWILDPAIDLPKFLGPRFKNHLELVIAGANADETEKKYEQRISSVFETMVDNDASRQSYLNAYLNYEYNGPHVQGSLIAFAKFNEVKLHCWKDDGGNSLRLVDGIVDKQNWPHPRGDAHILQDGSHFDELRLLSPKKFVDFENSRRAAVVPRERQI